MKILAIETATEACSAALLLDGEVYERYELAPRGHAQLILPMAEQLLERAGLRPADLDALAFGRGPGSFTGLRVAAGVVQGIGFAADLPVVPVSTLAALAQGVFDTEGGGTGVLAALDARMDEVYWGAYGLGPDGLAVLEGVERVCAAADVPVPGTGPSWRGAGTGWARYGEVLGERLSGRVARVFPDRFPRAGAVVRLAVHAFGQGAAVAAEDAVPVYLRDRVVQRPA